MSDSAERCERFRLAFAKRFEPQGWKYLKSRQALKKQVKDLILETYIGSSWRNSAQDIRIRMWFMSWCRSIAKKECQDACAIGFHFLPSSGRGREWWPIGTPEGYESAAQDASALFERVILPLAERLERNYEATVYDLTMNGYSDPGIETPSIRAHTAFCKLQFASHVFGDPVGQQAAQRRYEEMSEAQREAKRKEVQKYAADRERARSARANGVYFVDSDVMYLVDRGMIALGNDGAIEFPALG